MPTPKSVIKLTKNNGGSVEYTSNVDQAQYFVFELSRAALRDVAKYVKKKWVIAYYQHFKRHTGKAVKAFKYKVFSSRNTTAPMVQLGLPAGRVDGFYSFFQEVGTRYHPRLGLLQSAVMDNVAEIVKIESQYLSALSGEASALEALISEEEYEDED